MLKMKLHFHRPRDSVLLCNNFVLGMERKTLVTDICTFLESWMKPSSFTKI